MNMVVLGRTRRGLQFITEARHARKPKKKGEPKLPLAVTYRFVLMAALFARSVLSYGGSAYRRSVADAVGLSRRIADDQRQITHGQVARTKIAHLQSVVDTMQAGIDQQASFDGAKLSARVRRILTCLPEIQGEINGLTPEVADSTTVYLTNTQQISSYCSPLLYGRSTGD